MIIGKDNLLKETLGSFPELFKDYFNDMLGSENEGFIPDALLKKIRRVIITGNGDSYAVSLAAESLGRRVFPDHYALRSLDVSRHFVFPEDDAENTLVIVISVSGNGARAAEAVKRAAVKGCNTLVVTRNPGSRAAKESKYVLKINVPDSKAPYPANQTITFVSAMLTVYEFYLHAGVIRNIFSEEFSDNIRNELMNYMDLCCSKDFLEDMDSQMFDLADRWMKYKGYGFVGGGEDLVTAYFASAKFFEICGSMNFLNDSEDWCHIDYFQTDRDKIGMAVVAMSNNASYSRTVETIASMKKSGRDVVVISDKGKDDFEEGVVICRVPSAGYPYIAPLMNHIPLLMLANYISIRRGYEYFGGMDDRNPLFSQEGGINTIKSSKITIVD